MSIRLGKDIDVAEHYVEWWVEVDGVEIPCDDEAEARRYSAPGCKLFKQHFYGLEPQQVDLQGNDLPGDQALG